MTINISVIIPCRNEEAFIEKCLQSIIQQEYPREKFEIIVVDNGSTDHSKEIAQHYADEVIDAAGVNVGEVRNIGARLAEGKFLTFLDADCVIDKNWLQRGLKLATEQDIFGGGCLLPDDANWIESLWLLESKSGNVLPKELIGCSIFCEKRIFNALNGFRDDLKSGEDTDFSSRAKKEGYGVHITRALNVVHLGNAKTISDFFNRQAWHAQSYKNNLIKNLKDPVFIIVILTISFFVSGLIITTVNLKLAILLVVASMLPPLTLTVKRFIRAQRLPGSAEELAKCYFLDLTYILGRGYGLAPRPSIINRQ